MTATPHRRAWRPPRSLRRAVPMAWLLAACARSIAPVAPAAPTPVASADTVVAPVAPRTLTLPAATGSLSWRVRNSAVLRASAPGQPTVEQRATTEALVSWTATRTATGALRATGQVDSFVVRSSLDSIASRAARAGAPGATAGSPAPTLVLLDATLDSTFARVGTRPPLANECDRPEAAAAQLARELLLRIPDGLAVGAQWRDSSVTLVCRSGVPMTIYTNTVSVLEAVDDDLVTVRRTLQQRVEGKGGSPFQALEVSGAGSGTLRARLRRRDGGVDTLEETSTLTLQLTERVPSAPARAQQVVQQRTLRAERVRR